MNVLFLLRIKGDVKYVYDDSTLRQGLEKMRKHGYTAIPVISRTGDYVGTISEGDFLWHILRHGGSLKEQEHFMISDILMHLLRTSGQFVQKTNLITSGQIVQKLFFDLFVNIIHQSHNLIHLIKQLKTWLDICILVILLCYLIDVDSELSDFIYDHRLNLIIFRSCNTGRIDN